MQEHNATSYCYSNLSLISKFLLSSHLFISVKSLGLSSRWLPCKCNYIAGAGIRCLQSHLFSRLTKLSSLSPFWQCQCSSPGYAGAFSSHQWTTVSPASERYRKSCPKPGAPCLTKALSWIISSHSSLLAQNILALSRSWEKPWWRKLIKRKMQQLGKEHSSFHLALWAMVINRISIIT